jgi:metal-dependent HD superfamily phosphatase/phosphodiesterase
MVTVSLQLFENKIKEDKKVQSAFKFLKADLETLNCLQMANIMAVNRLNYNDHGPVHSKIVGGTALEIFDILKGETRSNVMSDNIGNESDAKLVAFLGAYFHDIGNSIHREEHHINGCIIANPILTRLLSKIYHNKSDKVFKLRQEILQSIYSHDEEINCLSFEAGVAKIADGCDMAEGRARIPYKLGKVDIHSLSALSITKVEVGPGEEKPLQIAVHMTNSAGIFQIEQVLLRKIETSSLLEKTEVIAIEKGIEIKRV